MTASSSIFCRFCSGFLGGAPAFAFCKTTEQEKRDSIVRGLSCAKLRSLAQ